MKKIIVAVALLLIVGCDEKSTNDQLPNFTALQAEDARRAVRALVDDRTPILAICGESKGRGFFGDKTDGGWVEDGIKDGRLVFLAGDDSDVVFRDTSGKFISARKDGGTVQRISGTGEDPVGSWLISYEATGITETHNVTRLPTGDLVDLWTSNKPPVIMEANVKAFLARCVAG